MRSEESIFGNLFDDHRITPRRLSNFAEDCLNRFIALNADNRYATIISKLTPALTQLRKELGDVDQTFNTQKAKTDTVYSFIENFKKTLSDEEPFIARKCGGKDSEAYKELFPNGLSEYWKATKANMATLVLRLSEMATKHQTLLGEEYTTILQSFKINWDTKVTAQEQAMGNVSGNRSERGEARVFMEQALQYAVFTIGAMYPGDVDQCSGFFNFKMLYGVKHQQEKPATPPTA